MRWESELRENPRTEMAQGEKNCFDQGVRHFQWTTEIAMSKAKTMSENSTTMQREPNGTEDVSPNCFPASLLPKT